MLTLKDFSFDFTQNGFFQFYSNPGQGKTAVLIDFAYRSALGGKKVIFIDCSSQISIKRFKQHVSPQDADKAIFFLPKTVKELLLTVDNIELLGIYKNSCICVDNIFFHRPERGHGKREEKQLKYHAYILSTLARLSKSCPVIMTNNSYKHEERSHRPYNEYLTDKWVQCNFYLWKKEGEIYLEDTG